MGDGRVEYRVLSHDVSFTTRAFRTEDAILTNLITRCRCGYQFCYLCGGKWKTCTCENWQERRLLEREGEIQETPGLIGQAGADDDTLIL